MDLIQVVAFCLFTTLVCCEAKPQFHHTTPLSLSYSTPSSISFQNSGSQLYTTPFSTSFRPLSQHSYNYNPVQVHSSSSIYRPTPSPIYTTTHSPIYSSSSAYVTPATSYLNRPGHLYGASDFQAPAQYSFGYSVQDDQTGNQSGHQETRNGGVTQGSYHVRLPDGRLQRVTYSVQDGSGFVADVSYEGTAQYPITQPQNLYQAPLIHRSSPYG
ncbi:cuticle protein 7-like [Palaemon carinicauda]|uniref:cuticle protein 7-like n=1 Tax=Palaemon carinicauda TaxID=392227 RepID=UPI0035B58C1D